MRSWRAVCVGFALGVALLVAPAAGDLHGQGVAFGAHGLWSSEVDFGIGGRVLGNIEDVNLEAVGEFNLFFPEGDLDFWEINGILFYHFHLADTRSVMPYLGGGLNIGTASNGDSETEIGLNLGGGVRFPNTSSVTPYIEGRGVVSDFDHFVITAGLLFGRAFGR